MEPRRGGLMIILSLALYTGGTKARNEDTIKIGGLNFGAVETPVSRDSLKNGWDENRLGEKELNPVNGTWNYPSKGEEKDPKMRETREQDLRYSKMPGVFPKLQLDGTFHVDECWKKLQDKAIVEEDAYMVEDFEKAEEIMWFQRTLYMEPSGKCDPETWEAMISVTGKELNTTIHRQRLSRKRRQATTVASTMAEATTMAPTRPPRPNRPFRIFVIRCVFVIAIDCYQGASNIGSITVIICNIIFGYFWGFFFFLINCTFVSLSCGSSVVIVDLEVDAPDTGSPITIDQIQNAVNFQELQTLFEDAGLELLSVGILPTVGEECTDEHAAACALMGGTCNPFSAGYQCSCPDGQRNTGTTPGAFICEPIPGGGGAGGGGDGGGAAGDPGSQTPLIIGLVTGSAAVVVILLVGATFAFLIRRPPPFRGFMNGNFPQGPRPFPPPLPPPLSSQRLNPFLPTRFNPNPHPMAMNLHRVYGNRPRGYGYPKNIFG